MDRNMFYMIIVLLVTMSFRCIQCDLDLPEGSPCISEGVNGTCVTLYKCYSAAITTVYRSSGYGIGPGFPEICSYTDTNVPIYCCTDCELDIDQSLSNAVVLPDASLQLRRPSLSWNICADYFQQLPYRCRGRERYSKTFYRKYLDEQDQCHDVVERKYYFSIGGRDATPYEFPHMALIGYGDTQNSAQWLCGGSVISERFILTAAHCTSTPLLGPITFAALGILKRTDLDEYPKVYKITRIISHPEYKSPAKYHDIALLETEREINFGRDLLPACLDTPITEMFTVYAEAPGWGGLGHKKPLADTLQVLELKSLDESVCKAKFLGNRHLKRGYEHATQMCYGAKKDTIIADTCEGDSGGPLQFSMDCLFTIVGVNSFGTKCGFIGSAGVYTRVKYYTDWIERQVWPDLYASYYNKTAI